MSTFIRLTSNNDKDKDGTIIYVDVGLILFFKHNNDHDGSYVKLRNIEPMAERPSNHITHFFVVETPDQIYAAIKAALKG